MNRNSNDFLLSSPSYHKSKLKLSSTCLNFKNTIQFNESSFMSKLKSMYEKRNNHKHIPFHIKKFKSSQSTLATEDDNANKQTLKILTRNKSEKIFVHPIFRQQQKYLTPKMHSPPSTPKSNFHPIYLSPKSIKQYPRNSTNYNIYSNTTNNNNVNDNTTSSPHNKTQKHKPTVHNLLNKYITLVLKKSSSKNELKHNESYPRLDNTSSIQLKQKQLVDNNSQTPRNINNDILLDKHIAEIFRKLPYPLQEQINEMLHLKIHVKYCENMFDLLNRKLDIRNSTNSPLCDSTAIESNVYNDMIDFIYQHKVNYSQHNDFTIKKEMSPEKMYLQSIKEKYKHLHIDSLKHKENIPKIYSSKNELKGIRYRKQLIQDIIEKGMKERKEKEQKIKELNKQRLNFYLIKEKEHSDLKIKYKKPNITKTTINNIETSYTNKTKKHYHSHINNSNTIDTNSININNNLNKTNETINNHNMILNYNENKNSTNNNVISTNLKEKNDKIKEIFHKEIEEQIENDEKDEIEDINENNIQRVITNKLIYEQQQNAKKMLIEHINDATNKKKGVNNLFKIDTDVVNKLRKRCEEEQKQIRELQKRNNSFRGSKILSLENIKKISTKDFFIEGSEEDKEYKMKELKVIKLSQDINYFLSVDKPKTENEKYLFEEFKEKINSLRQVNDETYISYISDNYEYLKEELENLRRIKENENQINEFVSHLNKDIQNNSMHRNILGNMVKFKDMEVFGKELQVTKKEDN